MRLQGMLHCTVFRFVRFTVVSDQNTNKKHAPPHVFFLLLSRPRWAMDLLFPQMIVNSAEQ